ncbi:TetR/AcrR family transcriptional regulator [Pseudomonas putida]|uniref:TetR/AcrR family transcriptional regulator n=1 Tax=Pseudomonas putida TaxID=303 RepID=UPI003F3D5D9E
MTQSEHVEKVVNDTAGRGSPEVWIGAAYEALLELGVDGVKILPLAKRLNLSRASFYWFFPDREALLDALVGMWREKNTGSVVKQANAYADTMVEAVLNVSDCWFNDDVFDSRFEFAMRSWAIHSQQMQAEIHEADEQRLDALRQMFARFGHEPMTADVCARALYLVQIGYITMQTHEDMSVRMARIGEYVKLFTKQTPTDKELKRFFSRHNYSAPIDAL